MKKNIISLITFVNVFFAVQNSSALVFNVTVPIGTNQCWLVGNFKVIPNTGGSWDLGYYKLTKVDATHFMINVPDADIVAAGFTQQTIAYKYLSGPANWAYLEKDATGADINLRSYNSADVVARWGTVYAPQIFTIKISTPKTVCECYITGVYNGWINPVNGTQMTLDTKNTDPNTNLFYAKIKSTPDSMIYKFAAGPGWAYLQNAVTYFTNTDSVPYSGIIFNRVLNYATLKTVSLNVTPPAGTDAVYLMGNNVKWDGVNWLTGIKNTDGTFTFTVNNVDLMDYSYFSAKDWGSYEIGTDGNQQFHTVDAQLSSSFKNVIFDWKNPIAFVIDIDGYHIVDKNLNSDYRMYLPYTYNTIPVITTPAPNYTITQATNINGTEAERTGIVFVPSVDGTAKFNYKIIFEKLPKLDLFLCIGQSNMVGYASLDPTQGDNNPINKGFLMNSNNLFEKANNPLASYSNIIASFDFPKLGPSYSFAKTISENTINSIGLIVNPRGASSINSWLKEGNGSQADTLYAPTIKRAIEAKKWGEFKAILWHQGEADIADTTSYKIKLIKLVSELRTDLGNNQLLFVAGQIGQWRTDFNPFNSMIIGISSFVSNSAYASTDNLTNGSGDTWHFDRPSQITLGERYAQIVINKLYSSTNDVKNISDINSIVVSQNQQLEIKINSENNTIQIFDISGKQLKTYTKLGSYISINLSNFEHGVYLVKIFNNMMAETKKIMLR